MTTFGAVTQGC